MKSLSELEATFVGRFCEQSRGFYEHRTIDEAQGILFVCPKCENHSILIWFSNPRNGVPVVPIECFPKHKSRWMATGDTIETLSLTPSIDLSKIDAENPASPSRCYWHGWVENGMCR